MSLMIHTLSTPFNAINASSFGTAHSQPANNQLVPNLDDRVTLSAQAIALSKQSSNPEQTLEVFPFMSISTNQGRDVKREAEFKKTKTQTQLYSDIASICASESNPLTAHTFAATKDEKSGDNIIELTRPQIHSTLLKNYREAVTKAC